MKAHANWMQIGVLLRKEEEERISFEQKRDASR